MDKLKYIIDEFNKNDIDVDEIKASKLLTYYEELVRVNEYMNLTAIVDFEEVVTKHFIDSAYILKYVDFSKIDRVIDIGTGAGFPGMVLAILCPDIRFCLVDSLAKRISFLDSVAEIIDINNVECLHSRSEDLAKNTSYRETFDLCVSRAVANFSTLSEYCIPFVKVGGQFISYKSGEIDDELDKANNAIKLLGASVGDIVKFNLADEFGRSFVMINKDHTTKKKYPRKAGTPSKDPL